MKKMQFIKYSLITILELLIFSCSSDDSKVEDYGTTTGNYFPLAVNNKWWYQNNGKETQVYVLGISDFNNVNYYQIIDTDDNLQIRNWIVKKGASYYQKVGETLVSQPGSSTYGIGEYEIKLFKDDLPIGGIWEGSSSIKVTLYDGGSPRNIPASLTYTGTILERDGTETLGSVTYKNIIKMQMNIVLKINSQITNINSEYWFAKDIGLIKETAKSSIDNVTITKYLTRFELN
jgi:hypothetical protein